MLVSLPDIGVLTYILPDPANAIIDTSYGIDALTYNPANDLCGSSYTDSFIYKVIDESDEESSSSTVNIEVAFTDHVNCVPTAT